MEIKVSESRKRHHNYLAIVQQAMQKRELILKWLRIGHTPLTHSYLFTEEKIPPEILHECKLILNLQHILVDCIKYDRTRGMLIVGIDLTSILRDDANQIIRVISFLKAIGLLHLM